jgi:bifunctional glutamyl/prolyl-tRNA synthetase
MEPRNFRHLYNFQDVIDTEVKKLLTLKNDFKSATGIDWKPGVSVPITSVSARSAGTLNALITQQGDRVRDLKAQKASKVTSRAS